MRENEREGWKKKFSMLYMLYTDLCSLACVCVCVFMCESLCECVNV